MKPSICALIPKLRSEIRCKCNIDRGNWGKRQKYFYVKELEKDAKFTVPLTPLSAAIHTQKCKHTHTHTNPTESHSKGRQKQSESSRKNRRKCFKWAMKIGGKTLSFILYFIHSLNKLSTNPYGYKLRSCQSSARDIHINKWQSRENSLSFYNNISCKWLCVTTCVWMVLKQSLFYTRISCYSGVLHVSLPLY